MGEETAAVELGEYPSLCGALDAELGEVLALFLSDGRRLRRELVEAFYVQAVGSGSVLLTSRTLHGMGSVTD